MNIRQFDSAPEDAETPYNAQAALFARSDLHPNDLFVLVGRYFNLFKRDSTSGDIAYDDDNDKHVVNACRVRWGITCQLFELDADQNLKPHQKREREERMARESKRQSKKSIESRTEERSEFDTAIVQLYKPNVETMLSFLSGFPRHEGTMDMAYEKLAGEAKRVQMQSKAFQIRRAQEHAKSLKDTIGEEEYGQLIEESTQLTTEEAALYDMALPKISEQKNETMCELFQSILDVIAYYLKLSTEHQAALPELLILQDPYVLVQRALRQPDLGTKSSTTCADLETVLFECLQCAGSDDVKVSAVECLARINSEKLGPKDIEEMVRVVVECQDVSKGRMEDVISGVLTNLQRIGEMAKTQSDPRVIRLAEDFHQRHAKQLIFATLNTLLQMSKRDFKTQSVTDKLEKASLCNVCVQFLGSALTWNEELAEEAKAEEIERMVREIFNKEERKGDPENPIRIEDTKCVAQDVQHVLKFLRPARITSTINTRLLHRIAVMLEGTAAPLNERIHLLDIKEEQTRKRELATVLGIHGMSTIDFMREVTYERFHEEEYHADVIVKLYPLGGDEELEKAGTGLPGTGSPFTTMDCSREDKEVNTKLFSSILDDLEMEGGILDRLFEMLTIDTERETFKLRRGEYPDPEISKFEGFNAIHGTAISDPHDISDEDTVKAVYERGRIYILSVDVGLCVSLPAPLPRHDGKMVLAVKPVFDAKMKIVGESGIDIMPRPIQCAADISARKMDRTPHNISQVRQGGDICYCWKGATASAALRALGAIVSYGTAKAKKALWENLHSVDEFAQFLLVAYQFGYYQFNIGIKVLDIAQHYLVDDSPMRKKLDPDEKEQPTLRHYWLAVLLCEDMLNAIAAKFRFDCKDIASGMRSRYARENDWWESMGQESHKKWNRIDLQGLATLAPREEALFLKVVEVYDMLVKQYPYIEIQWKKVNTNPDPDEEDEQVDPTEVLKLEAQYKTKMFPYLFLLTILPKMLQYIYYNQACMNHFWGIRNPSRERRAKILEHILSICAGMFLSNDMEKRYDILSMFFTMEGTEDPAMRDHQKASTCPYTTGFLGDFLQLTRQRRYQLSLTQYIIKNKWNKDRMEKFNHDERVIDAAWMLRKSGSSTVFHRVLLVCTNRNLFLFNEPYGIPCKDCPPEAFCPTGPELAKVYRYDQVGQLFRGADGSGFRLIYFKDAQRTMTENDNFVVYDHGVLDRLLKVILRFAPCGVRAPNMVCDQWTIETIKSHFPEDVKKERAPEEIEMCYSFEQCVVNGKVYHHVLSVLSTHSRLYFFHTNYSYWMCANEDDNVYFLEKLFEEPIQMEEDWSIWPHVADIDDPHALPSIEIVKEDKRKQGSRAHTIFQAYFASYVTMQTFWQGLRFGRFSLSTNNKDNEKKLTDLLSDAN